MQQKMLAYIIKSDIIMQAGVLLYGIALPDSSIRQRFRFDRTSIRVPYYVLFRLGSSRK